MALLVLAPGCIGRDEPASEPEGHAAVVAALAFSMAECHGIYSSYRVSYEWAAAQVPPGYSPAAVFLPTHTLAVMDHIVIHCNNATSGDVFTSDKQDALGPSRLAFAWIITANSTAPLQSFGYAIAATMDGPPAIADALLAASLRARVGDIALTRSAAALSTIVKDDWSEYTVDALAPVDAWIQAGRNVTLVMDNATYWLDADVETSQGRMPAIITVRTGPLEEAALAPAPFHVNSGFEFRGSITLQPARI